MTVKSGKSEGTVTVTPSGIPVYFQSEPKRLYRIAEAATWVAAMGFDDLLGDAQAEEPVLNWLEVPSVTTVLDVLDKPALPWWGMKIGAEGVAILHNLGLVKSTVMPGGQQPVLVCPQVVKPGPSDKFKAYCDFNHWVVAGMDQLVDVLNVQKLTVNHVRDKAGDRGQSVHDAFETWAQGGGLPDPEMYPPTEQGYILGLLAFLRDVPSAVPEASEVLVASAVHGFAGRYDVRFRTTEPHNVVVHFTPVKGPVYRQLNPGVFLGDLKTSKDVYPSHSRQLEGYEEASIESGYEPTDARGILHVTAEGQYKFKRSWATFDDFKAVLDLYNSDERMKLAEREDRNRK